MSTACYEELVQQTNHIKIGPPICKLPRINDAVNSAINLSALPSNPPSLKGALRFQHYESMLQILQSLKSGGNPRIDFHSSISKFRTFQEVMEVMFFENIIEDLLIESGFYSYNIFLHGNELLVNIMTYDFQKYKFAFRPLKYPDGVPDLMLRIANALWEHRVKLNATWSRMRVTAGAKYAIQLLPQKSMEQLYNIMASPVYCRISSGTCLQRSGGASQAWHDLSEELNKFGVSFVDSVSDFSGGRMSITFLDSGMIALSPQCRQLVYDIPHYNGTLIPQDVGSLVCISKMDSKFRSIQGPPCKKDVVISNCDKEGIIVNHIASYLDLRNSKLFVFDVPPAKARYLEEKFKAMSLKNVFMIPALFKKTNPRSDLFKNVGVVFCNPPNSLTAVHQPIDYLMQNGDELIYQLLKTKPGSFTTLEREQHDILSCALKFKQAEHIAYFTRSNLERENEGLVRKVLKEHTDQCLECDEDDDTWAGFQLDTDSKCMNNDSNGYLCTFKPAPPRPGLSASEVITKALQQGILNSDGMEDSEYNQQVNKKPRLNRRSKKRIFSHHEGIPLTFSAKQKVVPRRSSASRKGSLESGSSSTFFKQPKPFL